MIFLLYMILAILTTTISSMSDDTFEFIQKHNLQKYNITTRSFLEFLEILNSSNVGHSTANDASGETSSIDTTPYAFYQNDYTSTPDDVTTDFYIDDDYGETSSIRTTPYTPYQNDYTSSPYDVTTDLSVDSNDSTEVKERFITDTQLEMTMDAVAKVVAIEIQKKSLIRPGNI
ncbi:hypothetical protein HA402_011019 [Bradysia odoriphaga]|nr:hypothetical protein HA402_011019 [Bradysia odoriphaga]